MTITINKQVPEQIEIQVPGYFKKDSVSGSFKSYYKLISEKELLQFTLWESGKFCTYNYDSERDVIMAVADGAPISEEEFSIAATECYTRFFMASQTEKDETEVVQGFEHVLY